MEVKFEREPSEYLVLATLFEHYSKRVKRIELGLDIMDADFHQLQRNYFAATRQILFEVFRSVGIGPAHSQKMNTLIQLVHEQKANGDTDETDRIMRRFYTAMDDDAANVPRFDTEEFQEYLNKLIVDQEILTQEEVDEVVNRHQQFDRMLEALKGGDFSKVLQMLNGDSPEGPQILTR